jgi:hypothetical protein
MDYAFWQKHNVKMVNEKYSTEDAAKAVLAEFLKRMRASSDLHQKNEVTNYLFCPIMGAWCRMDCVCYKEHTITQIKTQKWNTSQSAYDVEDYWKIRDWECRNVLINGVIGVEQM